MKTNKSLSVICDDAKLGEATFSSKDVILLNESTSLIADVDHINTKSAWTEFGRNRFNIFISKNELIKLAAIISIVAISGPGEAIWIKLKNSKSKINSIYINRPIDCIFLNNFIVNEIKYKKNLNSYNVKDNISHWDLPYFGFGFQESTFAKISDAPPWVTGTLQIGAGAKSLLSIGADLLDFSVDPPDENPFIFEHFSGLMHGSIEVSFSMTSL